MTVLLCPDCLQYGTEVDHLEGCASSAMPLMDLVDTRKITATAAFLVLDAVDEETSLWTD